MNEDVKIFLMLLGGIVLFLIIALILKMEWLMNVLMRGILGGIAIYYINLGLSSLGFSSGVGLNAISVLTVGILGFPGFLVLYGIGFYRQL